MLTANSKTLYKEFISYRVWKRRKTDLLNLLYELEHDILELKAVQTDRTTAQPDPYAQSKSLLHYMEQKEHCLKEIARLECNLNFVEMLLNKKILKKSEKLILIDIYINGSNIKDAAKKFFYNEGYIYELIYNAINKLNEYLEKHKFIIKV